MTKCKIRSGIEEIRTPGIHGIFMNIHDISWESFGCEVDVTGYQVEN